MTHFMYRSDKWQVGQMAGRTNDAFSVKVGQMAGRTNGRSDKCRPDKRRSDKRRSHKTRGTGFLAVCMAAKNKSLRPNYVILY